MSDAVCPTCDRDFSSERGMRVHHSQVHGETLPNRECGHCGTEFHSEYEKAYCSADCRDAAVSFVGADNPNYEDKREITTCRRCSAEFEYYPSEKEGTYCPECIESAQWQSTPNVTAEANGQWSGGKERVQCAICETTVERWPSEINETTLCSEACRSKWLSEAFRGSGHPNWKGGSNIKYGSGWRSVREAALKRDEHTCQVCGATHDELGRNPDIHHITPVRWFETSDDYELTDAHKLSNVIALCSSCHRKAEFGSIEEGTLRSKIADSSSE